MSDQPSNQASPSPEAHGSPEPLVPSRPSPAASLLPLGAGNPRDGGAHHAGTLALAIGAVGVVFGDIGTSPLYALQETVIKHGSADRPFVMGVLSLVFWALLLIVVLKYQVFIMRATNRGEGGLFSLLSLLPRGLARRSDLRLAFFGMIAIFGSALLLGDGVSTPSSSVLQDPSVLDAVNPVHAVRLVASDPGSTFLLLGSIVLVVTGADALYADIGHFGIGPIRIGWFSIVWPCLLLNYFGQGAWIIANPPTPEQLSEYKPFYGLVPPALVIPMVVLATAATIIASQAMISGVFSMARQAIRLNYLPRLKVVHTSSATEGQIYVPFINWTMMVGCLTTVFLFRSATALAEAYGMAVTAVMVITSLLFAEVALRTWKWKPWIVWSVMGTFLAIDLLFLASNVAKILHGGWYALAIAAVGATVMLTWHQGSLAIGRRLAEQTESIHEFLARLWAEVIPRVPGTAVFMTPSAQAPFALISFVKHAHVLHEQVILLSMVPCDEPYVNDRDRVAVRWMPDGFWSVTAQVGFMEEPDALRVLALARERGLPFDDSNVTYFARKMQIVPDGQAPMARWRKSLYALLHSNAADVTSAFNLPSDRVVEFGVQMRL